MRKKQIMLISDDPATAALAKDALQAYDLIAITTCADALETLEKTHPDIAMLDIDTPKTCGYTVLKQIKANINTQKIPVFIITAAPENENEYEGLTHGAADYLTKPVNPRILQKRVDNHLTLAAYRAKLKALVKLKTEKIIQLQDAILSTVAEMVEFRDGNTGGHIDRTRCYIRILVNEMQKRGIYKEAMQGWDMEQLIQSSELHDVGKITIPDHILNKTSRLTDEEFAIMKTHAARGHDAISGIINKVNESEFLSQADIMAFYHHEKWDGTGYPNGLKGEQIPIQGRIMAIADVYDALISERPYKKAFTHEEAVKIITEGKGTQFDPQLVDLFTEVEQDFKNISAGTRR